MVVCHSGVATQGPTVEKVRILRGRKTIDVKDIEQVKVLAMHITTDSDLLSFRDRNFN